MSSGASAGCCSVLSWALPRFGASSSSASLGAYSSTNIFGAHSAADFLVARSAADFFIASTIVHSFVTSPGSFAPLLYLLNLSNAPSTVVLVTFTMRLAAAACTSLPRWIKARSSCPLAVV